ADQRLASTLRINAGQLTASMIATAPATAAQTIEVARLSPLLQPNATFVVPLAPRKMEAAAYAILAGHREPTGDCNDMGFALRRVRDQEPVVACQGTAGSPFSLYEFC